MEVRGGHYPQFFIIICPLLPMVSHRVYCPGRKLSGTGEGRFVLGIGFRNSQSFSLNVIVTGYMVLKHIDRLFVVTYLNP